METTPNPEEEGTEAMEDVSTILKNEIQSICTRLANLGEESLFLSAKVADQETTKLGSDTGFLFMSKFNIVQQFYQFVEDVYTAKPKTDTIKHPEDADQNQRPMDSTMETSKQVVDVIVNRIESKLNNNLVVSQSEKYQENASSNHGDIVSVSTGKETQLRIPENSNFGDVNVKTAGRIQQVSDVQLHQSLPSVPPQQQPPAGQTQQISDIHLNHGQPPQTQNAGQTPQISDVQLNQPPPLQTAGQTPQISEIQLNQSQPTQQQQQQQQTRKIILQGNNQSGSEQVLQVNAGNRDMLDSNTNPTEQIQTFHENIGNESQIPLQFVSNVPSYLPIGIGNTALPGVFVDQGNILPSQGFIPQYGISSHIPSSNVNTHIVTNAEMEKIDPTGIVNQALVQSGIHENLAQTQIEPGHQVNIEHAAGNQVSIDGTTAKLTIPEGLDILQSDDTSKYHFFLEALRFLNPELYPRTDFSELNQQRNDGVGVPYVEGETLPYSDAQHLTLPNPNLPNNFSDLPSNNQHMLNTVGQPMLVANSQEQVAANGNKANDIVPTEKKKKKKKKKKKDLNLLGKTANDLKPIQIKPPEIPSLDLSSSPSKKPGKGKSYKCDICNQFVESHRDIALHKVMHGGKIPPKCSICNNRFTTKRGLKHHMQKHKKPESSYSCEFCEKVFTNREEFVLHQQEHLQPLNSQNNAQTIRTENTDYTPSYEGQLYQTSIPQSISHFPQSEQLVSSAVNVPVGNVMCTISSNENVAISNALINQRIASGNQQHNDFIQENNSENLHQNVEQNHQIIYNVSNQGVEQNQQVLYNTNEENKDREAIYSSADLNQHQVSISQSENLNPPKSQIMTTEEELSADTEENLETDSTVGIMSKTGENLDLSKMENASDIVLDNGEGTKGVCKICGEEITSFEQTIVHFTIHKEQQSINESKKKREKVKEKSKKQPTRHRKGRKYACETCGQQFPQFNDLCLHRISHKGKSPEKCLICEKGFTSKRGVRLHMELHKKDSKPYLCNICKIEINDVQDFIDHKKSHGEEDDASSIVESVGYSESGRSSSNSLLTQHGPDKANQIHQNVNDLQQTTNEKGEISQTTNQIQQNVNSIPQSTNEKAEIHNTLNDIQTIIHHTISNHVPAGNYQPSYETGLTNNPQVLQQSATTAAAYSNPNVPLNIDPLQIAQMNLFFQQLNEQVASNVPLNLQHHDSTVEPQQLSKTMISEEQNMQKNTPQLQQSNLTPGIRKEKSSKIPKKKNGKYPCDECDEAFHMFHDLRLHKITHKGKTPQLCTVCNKLFVSKKGLRDHMTLHKKQLQKNICDICEKEFTDLNQLILHKLEHVEEARTKMSEKREKEMLMNKKMEVMTDDYGNQIVGEPPVANFDQMMGVAMNTMEKKGNSNIGDINTGSVQRSEVNAGHLQKNERLDENTGSHNIITGNQQVNTGSHNILTGSHNILTGSQQMITGNQNVVTESLHISTESQNILTGSQQIYTGIENVQAESLPMNTGLQNIQTGSHHINAGSQMINLEGQQGHRVSQNFATGNQHIVHYNNDQPLGNREHVPSRDFDNQEENITDRDDIVNQVNKETSQENVPKMVESNQQKNELTTDNRTGDNENTICSQGRGNEAVTIKKTDKNTTINTNKVNVQDSIKNSQQLIDINQHGASNQGFIKHSEISEISSKGQVNSSSKGQGDSNWKSQGDSSSKGHFDSSSKGHVDSSSKVQGDSSSKGLGDSSSKGQGEFNREKSKDMKLATELTCLIDHVSNDSTNDEHECPFCRERFSGPESLKQHLYIHIEDSDTPGDEQSDESMMKLEDGEESFNHEDEKLHMCDICGEQFSDIDAFDFHCKKHKKVKEYKCKVCCEIFTDLMTFKNHKKVKGHENRRHKCEICFRLFNKEENLKKHNIKIHKVPVGGNLQSNQNPADSKSPLTCAICGKSYRNKYKFNDHVNYHRGTTPHKCQICNKIFTRASGLKDHMNLHSGRKPYRCDVCGKRYADISNWRKHKTSHTNPAKTTPFKCSICKEKFLSWKQIKTHTALLHPDNLKFLRISNKPKLKKPRKLKK